MKVRSYKGVSLERLHNTIHQELGPEAVVLSSEKHVEKDGLFRKKPYYELLAVVDEKSAENALMDRLGEMQAEKWSVVEEALSGLRDELKGVSKNMTLPSLKVDNIPAYAEEWDPRFVKMMKTGSPHIFEDGNETACRTKADSFLRSEHVSFDANRGGMPNVVVFTGPTGSGKTTTMAKLAARWSLDEKLKVGLITTDTYRVAAVDQTREYATLLGVDLKVVFSASEASKAIQEFADKDVILVDTPGCNYRDAVSMSKLKGVLKGMGPSTVMLLVPAAMSGRSVSELTASFEVLDPDYLVITKVDEVGSYEVLTTLACDTACPVAFLTDGQRVPQDIRTAQTAEMLEMLFETEVCV